MHCSRVQFSALLCDPGMPKTTHDRLTGQRLTYTTWAVHPDEDRVTLLQGPPLSAGPYTVAGEYPLRRQGNRLFVDQLADRLPQG